MSTGEWLVDSSHIGKPSPHYSFQNLPRRVECNNGFVRLRLCIVVFALFSEDYGEGLFKVLGALTPMEACVEE